MATLRRSRPAEALQVVGDRGLRPLHAS